MSAVGFLLDEHVPPAVGNLLLTLGAGAPIWTVGVHPDAPGNQTPDQDLLVFAEENRLALVTFDKATMPSHVERHLAGGRQTFGVFVFANGSGLSPGVIARGLAMIQEASQAEEWIDQLVYLPL